jgi:hypothetical protein
MLHGTDTPAVHDEDSTLAVSISLRDDDLDIQVSLGLGCTAEVTLYKPAEDDLGPLVVLRADEWPTTAAGAPPRPLRCPRRSARGRRCRVRRPG